MPALPIFRSPRTRRVRRATAALALSAVSTVALSVLPAGADPRPLPEQAAAQAAARFVARQFNARGFIPVAGHADQPDLSATAQSVLALSAAGVDLPGAHRALVYLSTQIGAYVSASGADGPGQLAVLILDAVALGADPRSFGGTDLVSRLLATGQTRGADAGLFGTEEQLDDYDAGTYQQGLALAALAGAGVTGGSRVLAAEAWLAGQQCPGGGWTLPDQALNPCSGAPADYDGPDTNSTSLAVEGLAAEGALSTAVAGQAQRFLLRGQDADAGWSYYPSTSASPQATDPDSTALVLQALVALDLAPTSYTQGAADPVSALLRYQLTGGADAGAFYFPPAPAPASVLATYQAVPALMGMALPLAASTGATWLAGRDGGVFALGGAGYYGSLPGLGIHVHDVIALAPTPDGGGYWLGATDGGVFAFGDARYHGSMGGHRLNAHIVGLAATPDGHGYWLVASDGGVFAFGDARFFGSLPAGGGNANPVVSLTPTSDGQGYWLATDNGAVYGFGDARFHGSLVSDGIPAARVVALVRAGQSHGYWLVTDDGGVYAFGTGAYLGSLPGLGLHEHVTAVTGSPRAAGYLMASNTGGVFAFGDAVFGGSAAGTGVRDVSAVAAGSPAG